MVESPARLERPLKLERAGLTAVGLGHVIPELGMEKMETSNIGLSDITGDAVVNRWSMGGVVSNLGVLGEAAADCTPRKGVIKWLEAGT